MTPEAQARGAAWLALVAEHNRARLDPGAGPGSVAGAGAEAAWPRPWYTNRQPGLDWYPGKDADDALAAAAELVALAEELDDAEDGPGSGSGASLAPLLGEAEIARCHYEGLALPVWTSASAWFEAGRAGVLIFDWNTALGLWLGGIEVLIAEDQATADKLMHAMMRGCSRHLPLIRVRDA